MKRISDASKKVHDEFLRNRKILQECGCDPMNPCKRCIKMVTGKEYMKLLKFDNKQNS